MEDSASVFLAEVEKMSPWSGPKDTELLYV